MPHDEEAALLKPRNSRIHGAQGIAALVGNCPLFWEAATLASAGDKDTCNGPHGWRGVEGRNGLE